MRTRHNILWNVSLSNGEVIHEERSVFFKTVEGELSPWQKLLRYLAKNDLHITALWLNTVDGSRNFNIISSGNNPRFKAFADAPKPVEYKMFRKAGMDVMPNGEQGEPDLYTVAEATYRDENGVCAHCDGVGTCQEYDEDGDGELVDLTCSYCFGTGKKHTRLQLWVDNKTLNCWSMNI